MPTRRIRPTLALFAALCVAGPLSAQQPAAAVTGLRAELIADVQQLETKYGQLAGAMMGRYGWRPAEGTRSVGEVFAHVAVANMMIPTMVGVAAPDALNPAAGQTPRARMQELERTPDEARVVALLGQSFVHVRQAIASVPEERMDEKIQMFGRETTVRAALVLLVTHMHEHLGQAIAYARSNGVMPPWSGS